MLRSMIQIVLMMAILAGIMSITFLILGEATTAYLFAATALAGLVVSWRKRDWFGLP